MAKVIQDSIGLLTSFYDWSKTLTTTLSTNHIDRKLKPITTLSHALASATRDESWETSSHRLTRFQFFFSRGTWNSLSFQQSHTSYRAIWRTNYVIRVNLLHCYKSSSFFPFCFRFTSSVWSLLSFEKCLIRPCRQLRFITDISSSVTCHCCQHKSRQRLGPSICHTGPPHVVHSFINHEQPLNSDSVQRTITVFIKTVLIPTISPRNKK